MLYKLFYGKKGKEKKNSSVTKHYDAQIKNSCGYMRL